MRLAGQAGFDTHAWQLAWTLSTFFLRSAGDDEAVTRTWARALRIFEEIDHPDGDRIRAKLRTAASAPGM